MKAPQLRRMINAICRLGFVVISMVIFIAARDHPGTILFLGDSITAGYGLDVSQAYPDLIQKKIDRKGWNFKVVNAGQSGDTTAGGLSRLDWLLNNRIDVLVIELGGNDGLRGLPVGEMQKNLQAIIDRTRARYPDAKIIIAGMKVPPNFGGEYGRRFEAVFPDLAKKNHARWFHLSWREWADFAG